MKKYSLNHPVILLVIINVIAFWMLHAYLSPDNYKILYTGLYLLVISIFAYLTIVYGGMGDSYLFPIVYLLVT